jgi:hypothetical protein
MPCEVREDDAAHEDREHAGHLEQLRGGVAVRGVVWEIGLVKVKVGIVGRPVKKSECRPASPCFSPSLSRAAAHLT